jgi:hypothetical protein
MAITKPLDNAQIPDSSIAPVTAPVETEPMQVAGLGGALKGLRGTSSIDEIRESVEQRKIPTSTVEDAAEIAVPPGTPVEGGRPSATDPTQRNINLDRIEAEDEILQVIDTTSIQNDHFVTDRRGVRTIDESKAAAAEVDLQTILGRQVGEAFNAEQVIKARTVLVESAEQLQRAAKQIRLGNATEADMLEFRQMVAQHAAIQAQVSGMTAEAGRALNAFKVTAHSGMLRASQVSDALDGAGGVKATKKLAELIDEAEGTAAVSKAVRKNWGATTSDMILEFWINGLLSSPATHAVNTTSNALVAMWQVPERFLAAGISKITPGDGVVAGEAVAQAYGMVQGSRDGIKLFWRALKTGEPSDAAQKYEARKHRAITAENVAEVLGKGREFVGLDPDAIANGGFVARGVDLLGEGVRLPGRFLGAEDEFFKAVGYRMELNALAYRQAASEGLTGQEAAARITEIVNNPPESLHLEAVNASRIQTFTNQLNEGGRSIQKIAASNPALKLILPFIRTPTNIVKFVGMRSPLAPFAKSFRADVQAGGARRDLALARMAMGTLVFGAGMEFAASGTITGKLSENKGVRDAQMRKGLQPYSIKIGDQLYAFNRMDPLGMFLGLTADAVEVMKYADDAGKAEVAAAVGIAIAQNLTSRTYLRGLSEFITAMDDPDRYMESYLRRMAATFVPYTSLVAGIERQMDPTLRAAYTVMDQVRSRTPGLSEQLPPRRNLWGNPIVLGGALGWDIVSPIYTSTEIESLADDEIINNEVDIRMPRKTISRSKNGVSATVELMPEEYDRYVFLAGQGVQIDGYSLKDYLENVLIPSDAYQSGTPGPDGMRALMLKKVVTEFRDQAKEQLLMENKGLRDVLQSTWMDNAHKLHGRNE